MGRTAERLEGPSLGERLEAASELLDTLFIGLDEANLICAAASAPLEPGGLLIRHVTARAHPKQGF